ncbi:MAG TPA: ABC transporter permease [Candidatus Polarisedimenticolia bacterium]|nr:ABC transporter permease [Candidatus Polarisedimenticolia bacterium]
MRDFPIVWRMFLSSARLQKKRATLTIAAIAWGTVALLLLLSFGEGLKRQMVRGSTGMGSNLAVLWPGETSKPWQGLPSGRPIRPVLEDVDLIRERVPGLEGALGEFRRWGCSVTWGRKTSNLRVTGTSAEFGEIRNHIARRGGRFLNEQDVLERRRVIFMGDEAATELFGEATPEGQVVLVNGSPYLVIGVMQKKIQMGTYGGPDAQGTVIPITTFKAQFGSERLENIVIKPNDPAQMKAAIQKTREVLAAKYKFDPADQPAIGVWDTVESGSMMRAIMLGIQIFLGVIGGLTLLIGGVGVANIMYATVKERTREIGVKMALGARPGWVTGPLVLEGLLYTITGGLVGMTIAVILIVLLGLMPVEGNRALEFLGKPTLSPAVGVASAAILGCVGLLAAWFPARRAAAVEPAVTLRYE